MVERRTEILPKWGLLSWEIGRENQYKHVSRSKGAGTPYEQTQDQRYPNSKLTVSHDHGDEYSMRQDEFPENRHKERINCAFL